jgi:drug/metabolite transporter (DMT)-like permease
VALRNVIGASSLLLLAALRRRIAPPPRADLPVLLSITLLHMVGFTILTAIGLLFVPAGRSVVLAYTTPLWVTPGAWLLLGERYTMRKMIGVVVGLLGLVILFNPLAFDWSDRRALVGNVAILAGAFSWAGSILHIRAHRWQTTPFALLPWELALASSITVPAAFLVSGPLHVEWSARLVWLMLYSGIPGNVVAYWAVASAGRRLPASTVSLGLLATPIVGIVVAAIWLGEPGMASMVIAVLLVLGGVALGVTETSSVRPRASA